MRPFFASPLFPKEGFHGWDNRKQKPEAKCPSPPTPLPKGGEGGKVAAALRCQTPAFDARGCHSLRSHL